MNAKYLQSTFQNKSISHIKSKTPFNVDFEVKNERQDYKVKKKNIHENNNLYKSNRPIKLRNFEQL
jgi:hypothetical protein